MSSRSKRATVAVRCATVAAAATAQAQVQIGDTEFAPSDWVHSALWSVGTVTLGPMTQQAAGGNPGAFQRGRHTSNGPFATIYDGHVYVGGTYSPATQGAVTSLDISYDYLDFLPGGTQNGLLVVQNGRSFIRFVDSAGPHTSWTTLTHAGILPNDPQWSEASAAGITQAAPDFSASGGPMQFGFYTFNWSLSVGFFIEREWGIDNFRVTIHGAACYPDCTGDGALTVADFGCFQTKFVQGDPYADCNADGSHTVADFGCFQTKFVLGCP